MKYVLALLFFGYFNLCFAGWTDLNTGINDDLTGVVFWGNNGLVSGSEGLYYTTTGGVGPASWTHYTLTGNGADSLLYLHTRFSHAFAYYGVAATNNVYVCGTDTVDGRAVIMHFSFPSLTCNVIYTGTPGSSLKRIGYNSSADVYYAVGDDGLIVSFTSGSASVVNSGLTNDLTSVSFYANYFFLGSNGTNIYGSNINNPFSYTSVATPGNDYQDVYCVGNNIGYRVGDGYYFQNAGPIQEYTAYDYGPLEANSIGVKSGYHFVGTSHGIFRSSLSHTFLEYQPTSAGAAIYCFWYQASSPTNYYACGKNGKLLLSTDNGGLPKPIAILNIPSGGCVGSILNFTAATGSSTSCQWYANASLISSSCSGTFGYSFGTPGSYTIQLNVTNGVGSYDTATQVINIVPPPQINKPVSINDSILCHAESINITIDSSQINVIYTLKKFGSPGSFGSSGPGTGGTINFTSLPVSSTGYYYLQAQSSLASCAANFTDTIFITVEQTTSKLHETKVNVTQGEQIQFYENCIDAQNFAWSFSPAATPSTSGIPDPIANFANLGSTNVELISWSNNGCYDTLITSGPKVYLEPTADSCWTIANLGEDQGPIGFYFADVAEITPGLNGFYSCGTYWNPEKFTSRYGDSLQLQPHHGTYVEKLNYNGVLKWMVYTRQVATGYPYRDQLNSVLEDEQGNVYLAGRVSGYFFDNTGDSTLIDNNYDRMLIAKLDSAGKLVWKMVSNDYFEPTKLALDHSGNLLVLSGWGGAVHYAPDFNFYRNDTTLFVLSNSATLGSNYGVLKLDPNGNPILNFEMFIYYLNYDRPEDISSDYGDNIYITGSYESQPIFYSAGSNFQNIPNDSPSISTPKIFVTKYNSLGEFQWVSRTYIDGGGGNHKVQAIATDSLGNSYITGSNGIVGNYGINHVFEDADSSSSTLNSGGFFVAKLDSSGNWGWRQGASYSYYGYGYELLLDQNEVSVVGQIFNNPATTEIAEFTSSNGTTKMVDLNRSDYLVVSYDTSGNLLRIIENGVNPVSFSMLEFDGFFKRPDNSYYIGMNAALGNGVSNYWNFGTNIDTLYGNDGIITKFHPDCGIVHYPCYTPTTISPVACDTFVSSGGHIYTNSGFVQDTLFTLTPACDTIYSMNLTILQSTTSIINQSACNSFTLNSTTYNATGIYTQVIPNQMGCDSTITLDLTINTVNTGIATFGNMLIANSSIATSYQWINCAGNVPIPGATSQTYVPTVTGNYAVIVTENGCIDTSICLLMTVLGVDDYEYSDGVFIYPNPTTGMVNMHCSSMMEQLTIRVMDISGKVLGVYPNLNTDHFMIDLSSYMNGIYFIELFSPDLNRTISVVKNN